MPQVADGEPGPPRWRAGRRRLAMALVAGSLLAVASGTVVLVRKISHILEPAPLPVVPPLDTFAALFDTTPIHLTITADWQKVPMTVPAYLVESDHTLWLKMHFEDWDTVPTPVREAALTKMISRYRGAIDGPRTWARMTAEDWDRVPQPIRAMAFVRMARYWSRHYRIGRDYEIPSELAADTVAALVMVESWFEHRGTYTNRNGSEDLGLGGASAFCRARIRELHALGEVDVDPADSEYVEPWTATRVLAIWFGLMLDEAGGDLDLAIAAYHTGIGDAASQDGKKYAANVRRKRRRFIRNVGAPPAWTFLVSSLSPAKRIAERAH